MGDELLPWVYFNETICQLMDDLKLLFSEDDSFVVMQGAIKIYTATNKKMLQQKFLCTFGPYFDKILAKDETFFYQHSVHEYQQDLQRNYESDHGMDDNMLAKCIDIIKTKFASIDHSNKDIIWKYLEQLVHLCNVCDEQSQVM